jgi:HEPN domain-containing protein
MSVDPVQEWLVLAFQDEQSARFLTDMHPLPLEVICFHCQQSAEKLLKALIEKNSLPVPKTHDLLLLLDIIRDRHPSLINLEPAMYDLNDFSVVVRYPAHVPLEASDTINALKSVDIIRAEIIKILNS